MQAKLTVEDVAAIREAWDAGRIRSLEALGAKYKVSVTTIAAIVNRKTWKNVAESNVVITPHHIKASRIAFG